MKTKFAVYHLKDLLIVASTLRENSWTGMVYERSIQKACQEACERMECDPERAPLLEFALTSAWNESLAWANK